MATLLWDRWSFYFEDLFRAGARMGPGLNLFHFWIREWLLLDRPYDQLVTDLLTGAGKTSFFRSSATLCRPMRDALHPHRASGLGPP